MKRTWNVEVEESYAKVAGMGPDPVEPGGTVQVARFNKRETDGTLRFGGLLFKCPLCGYAGSCPAKEAAQGDEASWDITGLDEGRVTMRPSIDCTMPLEGGATCSGHYWLTDGVLTEV